jgi:outer membrane biosynthesis protein TonB
MNLLRNFPCLVRGIHSSATPQRRWLDRSLSASLLLALAAAGVLGACGSTPEVVKQPDPVKVQWSKTGEEADDSRGSGDDATGSGTEVDLDAPPAKEAAKESAKEPPKPAEPPPAPEPPAEPKTEAPAEAAAEPAAEAAAEEAPAAEPPAAVPLGKELRAAVRGKEPKEKPAKKGAKSKKAPPAEAAPAAAATYSGTDACRAKSFSISRVGEACARNGRAGAKSVMKEAIGKALAGGASLKCADCHADLRSYALKKDAVAQLKKWLGS